jgi:glycosyltransferase involved in cell wall biosynthesis
VSLRKPQTLYICYFGLSEPLVQTQVLPYLREIQKDGLEISLLTFEPDLKKKWTAEKIEIERKKLADENIKWHYLAYHKRPSAPATAFDVLCGALLIWRLLRREKFEILHARIHVPMLMAVLARKFSRRKPKINFDIRGFFPEEYTDAGVWKEDSLIFRLTKKVERWLMKEADAFVVLTEKARQILFPESKESGFDKYNRPVEVIPCCIDANRFDIAENFDREEFRRTLNLDGKKVFVYVGSFGGWYLTDEIIGFIAAAHRQNKNAFSMILTQRDSEKVEQLLREKGLKSFDFSVGSVTPSEVPHYLNAADIAISFIKPCYSKQASSPTKIAEYLAGGLPVISNSGIGDLDELIEGEKVGVILNECSEQSYSRALTEIQLLAENQNLPEHCRKIAHKHFDLESVGGERYRRLYRRLLQS